MRSEKEMMDLILGTAMEDERIRAVVMNGSRVNPDAPKDIFQDYDIIYFVTDMAPYIRNFDWIGRFGELIIMQMPCGMGESVHNYSEEFVYLMQFTDGNRIDLSILPVEKAGSMQMDSLSLLLLDKDKIFGKLPEPNNSDYLTREPDEKQFLDCCNEFWWVSTYVAKGLWRDELPYVKYMFEHWVRDQLMKMLTWKVCISKGFSKSTGKEGKYLKRFLEPELWDMFIKTYPDANTENIWQSLFVMCDLFRISSAFVARHYGFSYPKDDDERVYSYLQHIRNLPKDASEIY